jgi:hypothetical protein
MEIIHGDPLMNMRKKATEAKRPELLSKLLSTGTLGPKCIKNLTASAPVMEQDHHTKSLTLIWWESDIRTAVGMGT